MPDTIDLSREPPGARDLFPNIASGKAAASSSRDILKTAIRDGHIKSRIIGAETCYWSLSAIGQNCDNVCQPGRRQVAAFTGVPRFDFQVFRNAASCSRATKTTSPAKGSWSQFGAGVGR